LYAINLGAARLFANSPFSIFNNLKFVMIYVFFNLNYEFIFLSKKNCVFLRPTYMLFKMWILFAISTVNFVHSLPKQEGIQKGRSFLD
jgi:hypothetical protein